MALVLLPLVPLILAGCGTPHEKQLQQYLASSTQYLSLPPGPERLDAAFLEARRLAGTNKGALALLGRVAVGHGLRLRHPFNTGLTPRGPLAPVDKAGHFFAHAWWEYQDRSRWLPLGRVLGYVWEGIGEVKSWVATGAGFDWTDIWANRIGRRFGAMLHDHRNDPDFLLLPSAALEHINACRPEHVTSAEPDP